MSKRRVVLIVELKKKWWKVVNDDLILGNDGLKLNKVMILVEKVGREFCKNVDFERS